MEDDLPKSAANHVALSPVSFLARAARIWPGRTAIIHGARRVTYAAYLDRSRRLASALRRAGVHGLDVIALTHPDFDHYGGLAAVARGLPVTCAVSAHHLMLNELDVGAYLTFRKVRPPLRSEADRAAMAASVIGPGHRILLSCRRMVAEGS